MRLSIGENIKRLRRERDITQGYQKFVREDALLTSFCQS